jgi:hypothetical protein
MIELERWVTVTSRGILSALMSIVIIDLVLAGDNAVVIAMAVKNDQPHRTIGIALGRSRYGVFLPPFWYLNSYDVVRCWQAPFSGSQ